MKILFVYTVRDSIRWQYPLKGQEDIQMGISYISSLLKVNGHKTRLVVLDRKSGKNNRRLITSTLEEFNPSMVCFTSVNSEIDFVNELAAFTKKKYHEAFLLLGGVHVTLNPDEKYLEVFDALCIGEGEYPVLELAGRLETGSDFSDIENLWIKKEGRIIKNQPRPFINDIDRLPFADRDMWQEWILDPESRQVILLGRGCPYNCSYCCNHKLRKITSGQYVRVRDPEKIVEELELITTNYKTSEVFLEIETLGVNLPWLEKLCLTLKAFNETRIKKISFSANLRIYPGIDTDYIFSNLSQAGFGSVTIGLESGSERIRKEVLNRNYSNSDILNAVNAARKYGIKIGIFNLIGLPTETPADFLETLRMNQVIQPDWHATSIFFPYEGTGLYDTIRDRGLLPLTVSLKTERQFASIDYPEFPARLIQKKFDSFHFDVYRKAPHKSVIRLVLFFIQKFAGHHFMAVSKNLIINILSRINLKAGLLMKIIQKA